MKNPAMLFHVDMIYLAKQAKCDVEKSFALRSVRIFYVRKTNKGCHVHAMCKMPLF